MNKTKLNQTKARERKQNSTLFERRHEIMNIQWNNEKWNNEKMK